MSNALRTNFAISIVEVLGDALLVSHGRRIRVWNTDRRAPLRIHKAEALGNSLDLIIPERLPARHWAVTRSHGTRETPTQRHYGFPAVHKNGRPLIDCLYRGPFLFGG